MKKEKRVFIVMFCLLLGIAIFSGFKILSILSEYRKSADTYEEIADEYVRDADEKLQNSNTSALVDIENQQNEFAPITVSFEELWTECSDAVAWIYCEDTPINYPIVQSEDNSYYLRRLLDGTWNIAGSIFEDYRNAADFTDWNTIIYGHNMNNDSMFGSLENYKNQEYYEEHPVIFLLTPEQDYKVELIGGYVTDGNDTDTYSIPTSAKERDTLIEKTRQQSTFQCEVVIDDTDRIVTLSTCAYEFDGARYVLIGVLRELDRK